jgi:hypothetical protein
LVRVVVAHKVLGEAFQDKEANSGDIVGEDGRNASVGDFGAANNAEVLEVGKVRGQRA